MARAMKVAIVDDEADMRQSISQWLALSGFDTETYASAEEALKGIGPEFPGVVVSDIKMPVMDGIALSLHVGARYPEITILLMTGFADQRERADDLMTKVIDVVDKPFALPDIRRAVARALAA